jgi:YD repeat-containing protein
MRRYNSLFQLTRITAPTDFDIQYAYSATQNNGKIISQTDTVSGEQITYTYDALNRLASAVTSDNPNVTQWGQSYNYDGFGNLTDQNVIKGSAPTMHVVYSAANNRAGDPADANQMLGG